MGYGALSATDYFDSPGYTVNPKVYMFKQGRNGWSAGAASYPNTKPIGASPISTPGPFTPSSSYLGASACTGTTPDSALVRCIGLATIAPAGSASSGEGAWTLSNDSSYKPVDIRETVPAGQYIFNHSSAAYSLNIPLQDLFKADTKGD